MLLKNLPIGTVIQVNEDKEFFKTFSFLLIDKNHFNKNEINLMLIDSIEKYCFDANEHNKYENGNPFYSLSNMRNWLNSIKIDWYLKTHEYDTAPIVENVLIKEASYFKEKGFLLNLGKYFNKNIIPVNIENHENILNTLYDQKVIIPSYTEITGKSYNSIYEGSQFLYLKNNKIETTTRTNSNDKIISVDGNIINEKYPNDISLKFNPIISLDGDMNVELCYDDIYEVKEIENHSFLRNRAMSFAMRSATASINNYETTKWIDEETLVDAMKLNKIEKQLKGLSDDNSQVFKELNTVSENVEKNKKECIDNLNDQFKFVNNLIKTNSEDIVKVSNNVANIKNVSSIDNKFSYNSTAPSSSERLNYNGYFYATRVYNAVYNDYAEYFEQEFNIPIGNIVALGDNNKYTLANKSNSKTIVGVSSDEYAQCIGGNGNKNDKRNFVPVGMSGRVHVKILGKVKKGDLITVSKIAGIGKAISPKLSFLYSGKIVGKALENSNDKSIKPIRILIAIM